MDSKQIDDLVKMLDSGMASGVGHVNVDVNEEVEGFKSVEVANIEVDKSLYLGDYPLERA